MFQSTRLNEILEYFLNHREYITPSRLAAQFQVSERTLRSDIREINRVLEEHQVQILLKRKEGYYLHTTDASTLSDLEEIMKKREKFLDSTDHRIHHLIMKLLYADHYLSQDDLAEEVYVSINTIINYLKSIRDILASHNLTLHNKANLGYLVMGEELDKRKCIMDLITTNSQQYALQFSNDQKALLKNAHLETVKKIVIDFNRAYSLHFTDYNLKNLILQIVLSVSRVQAGKTLDAYPMPQSQQLKDLLHPLIAHIESIFHVNLGIAERNYIYSYYISNTSFSSQNDVSAYTRTLVQKILNFIYDFYRIDIRNDAVIQKDLSQHLQSILNAKYYDQHMKNPLLETIKTTYILAYEITTTSVYQAFETEPYDLCENDIGYIALHVGAAIERYFDDHCVSGKKAILVYGNSYAEGSFLAAKLSTLFRGALEIVGRYPSHELNDTNCQNVDLIISATPIKYSGGTPVVTVEIPLRKNDIENITKAVIAKTHHPIDTITDLFSPSLFIRTKVKTREEIVHILCTLLKKENCIMDTFEESVLKRESRISTAMDGVIALPHPLAICSYKSRIAIGILEKPIRWSEKDQAQIILMLALSDERKHDIRALYDTLVLATNNPALENLLLQSHSTQEFLKILKENIAKGSY